MKWIDIWKIVICAVGSAGGMGAIIVVIIKFSVNKIAERLSKKYEAKLQKELEKFRSSLEEKNHISKAQFDMEFEVYRNVTGSVFDAIREFNSAFSPDYKTADAPIIIKKEMKGLLSIADKLQMAQDELYKKSAFIPLELYVKFDELIQKAQELFWEYRKAINDEDKHIHTIDDEWLKEKYRQLEELDQDRNIINNDLRDYLRSMVIVN